MPPVLSRRAALRAALGSASALALGALAGCAPQIPAAPATTPTPRPAATVTPQPTATTAPSATPQPPATAAPATPTAAPTAADLNAGVLFTRAGDPAEKCVALTIDDFLWDDVIYWWMVDYLRENPDVRLTMFPVGNRVRAVDALVPGIWAEWLAMGHEIGWHSMNHEDFGSKTADDLRVDIAEFTRTFREVLGDDTFTLRWARTPFGNYDSGEHFAEVGEELGLTWVLWGPIPSHANSDPLERPDSIKNGDISLFHVRWQDQYWLERYVEFVRMRGFEMVTLSGMRLVPEDRGVQADEG